MDNEKKEKTSLRTAVLCLILAVLAVSGVFVFGRQLNGPGWVPHLMLEEAETEEETIEETEAPEETVPAVSTLEEVSGDIPEGFYANTLFIGDSRTVGLSEYGGMEGCTFFCDTGMSVYRLDDAVCTYDDLGTVTLAELLAERSFDRIYFMLGINEAGSNHDTLMERYTGFVNEVREADPDAQICICANMHVGAAKNASGGAINNAALDDVNTRMAGLAVQNGYIYIDCNTVFDDENGCLSDDYSGDGIHPTASGYRLWAIWLANYVAY